MKLGIEARLSAHALMLFNRELAPFGAEITVLREGYLEIVAPDRREADVRRIALRYTRVPHQEVDVLATARELARLDKLVADLRQGLRDAIGMIGNEDGTRDGGFFTDHEMLAGTPYEETTYVRLRKLARLLP